MFNITENKTQIKINLKDKVVFVKNKCFDDTKLPEDLLVLLDFSIQIAKELAILSTKYKGVISIADVKNNEIELKRLSLWSQEIEKYKTKVINEMFNNNQTETN